MYVTTIDVQVQKIGYWAVELGTESPTLWNPEFIQTEGWVTSPWLPLIQCTGARACGDSWAKQFQGSWGAFQEGVSANPFLGGQIKTWPGPMILYPREVHSLGTRTDNPLI